LGDFFEFLVTLFVATKTYDNFRGAATLSIVTPSLMTFSLIALRIVTPNLLIFALIYWKLLNLQLLLKSIEKSANLAIYQFLLKFMAVN
jgi:hypothetical protein